MIPERKETVSSINYVAEVSSSIQCCLKTKLQGPPSLIFAECKLRVEIDKRGRNLSPTFSAAVTRNKEGRNLAAAGGCFHLFVHAIARHGAEKRKERLSTLSRPGEVR